MEPMDSAEIEARPDGLVTPPKQARSRRTLQAIVDAALTLLAERGLEGATVHEIVERAGTSVGSFYARFGGKDDLLRYLELRLWDDARARWDETLAGEAWDDLELVEVVDGLVRTLVEAERVGARQRRALGRRTAGARTDPAADFHAHLLDGVRALLLDRRDAIGHPDPPTAVRLGYRAVVGAIRECDARGDDLDDDRLIGELARLYLAYLGAAGADRPATEGGPVDYFDVWA